ncbi:recombinase RecT [Pseudotabrizicola alkalilacus]|uniref:Recombinase RecT n=1 Tax=Pseudotabrizicola alkalilacus TaxID=2305252 RepID=A0A411Z4D7_9RHOB|nr:recombinase RecT [Pseudotabrizicola alkalilacus]RGP37937.1 hypothetical protein D1012_08620 [Pseudotabrizicola alkalilacus]
MNAPNAEPTAVHPAALERAQFVEGVKNYDPGLGAYNFANLGDLVRFADLMAKADVMLPKHLRNKPSICLAVAMRATHWKMDPFALAVETYQAKDDQPIAYQAKVFVAALKNCAGIELQYRFEGDYRVENKPAQSSKGNETSKRTSTGDRKCIAYAEVNGKLLEYETPTIDNITIKNSPLWHNDPDQQLAYYAGRGWTRRYRPGVIMGAYSVDEVEEMRPIRDVTPAEDRSKRVDGFAAIATKARAEGAQDAAQGAAYDSDDESEQAGELFHWTYRHDPLNAIPGSKEWTWGEESAADPEQTRRACPFEQGTQEADDWLGGFIGKRRAME